MNLLMLLSALLSALTGVGAAVRRPEVAQAIAQVAATDDVARTAVVPTTRRPVASRLSLRVFAGQGVATALALAPLVAPWTNRRRE